jgi:hypothetical protein
VTRRDSYILMAVGVLGAIAAFWLLALAPKREKLSTLDKDVAEARQTLEQAKQEKVKFARDQIAFPRLYASLGRLGKAVPADQDVPSLLVQLNHAAAEANVNFHSVELKLSLASKIEESISASASASAAGAAPGTTPPAGAAPGTTPPAGGEGAQTTPPAGGTGTQTTPPAATPAPGTSTAAAGSTTTPAPGAATPAPGAATPAPGATATPTAGQFKVLPFEYIFKGNFFELEKIVHNVTRLVERRNQELAVMGRLITIRGFSLKRGKITVLATTFMLPADQALFGGATPQGPATDPAAPQAASAPGTATPTPPTAAVTGP